MATLIEADLAYTSQAVPEPTFVELRPSRRTSAPASALSRGRGGTFSATVGEVWFADGRHAHTDLIRLNPNIDAYSLDVNGVSPRQLSHYREVAWTDAPIRPAEMWQAEITAILASSYPQVGTAELTRRLRVSGYPVGFGELREHEAIAATQAAIWRLTNGLELDTRAIDEPVRGTFRIGAHPAGRAVPTHADGTLSWLSQLPSGQPAYLELELAGTPELHGFGFQIGAKTGRHPLTFWLEASLDGWTWQPISGSRFSLARPSGTQRVHRRLGLGATVFSARAVLGSLGYGFYRLAVLGPAGRDGLIEIGGFRVEVAAPSRYVNNERVVYLYDHLLSQVAGALPQVQRAEPPVDPTRYGPFALTLAPATILTDQAAVVDEAGHELAGPVAPGKDFYLRPLRAGTDLEAVQLRLHHQPVHTRVLVGSRTPGGAGEFTPLITVTAVAQADIFEQTVPLTPQPQAEGADNRRKQK